MRQIIAIGGGGFGRSPGQGQIENYILQQSKKKIPKICFVPTATGDDDHYKLNFYSTFSQLNCRPSVLDLFKRTPNLERLVSDQDIIFVGGGNTKSMLAVWQDWGLDRILTRAYNEGVVMSGVSAGAICWFKNGVTDSWEEELKLLPCLGFLEGACCPHYDEEKERRPAVRKMLLREEINNCFCIEGECAIHFKDENVLSSVSFGTNKKAYEVSIRKGKVFEKNLTGIQISHTD